MVKVVSRCWPYGKGRVICLLDAQPCVCVCRDLVVAERDGKIQELKDTISQLNLERTELITKVTYMYIVYVYM